MIKNKVSKVVGIINTLKWKLPTGILRNLYNSLMLPYLTYCTTAWAGGSPNRLKPIFLLQKRVIRIIAGVHYLAHSSPLFKSLNLLSISDVAFPEKFFAENFPEIFQKLSGNFPQNRKNTFNS